MLSIGNTITKWRLQYLSVSVVSLAKVRAPNANTTNNISPWPCATLVWHRQASELAMVRLLYKSSKKRRLKDCLVIFMALTNLAVSLRLTKIMRRAFRRL